MTKQQSGFTLIELVMVIVILGILAATALPKFVDLQADARDAAIKGAAGALTSYAAINYSAFAVKGTTGGTSGVVAVSNASGAAALTASMAGWDSKFAIGTEANCNGSSAGATARATLSYSGGTTANTATATIVCTG